MVPILELLVLSLTLQLSGTSTAASNHVYTYCPNTTRLTRGPTPPAFQYNLQTLLSDLSAAANSTTTTGFSYLNAGTASGIFLCRGDVLSATCASCVANAAAELNTRCSGNSKAIIWYDECMIKYSDATFSSELDDSLRNYFWSTTGKGIEMEEFNGVLATVASNVREEAATAGGGKMFATMEGKVAKRLTVFVLGQCTPDLSVKDCRRCLDECIKILPSWEDKVGGGTVLFPSCNFRFETYKFYSSSSSGSGGGMGGIELLRLLHFDSSQYRQLQIEFGVLFTNIFLFGILVLGCARRRVDGSWPGVCIILLSSLITVFVPFLLGLMRSANLPGNLFPIWSSFLFFTYGGFDTMTARKLTDNDNVLNYWLSIFAVIFWVFYGLVSAQLRIINGTAFIITCVAYLILYFISAWNTIETGSALEVASKSKGLPEASKLTEHHMRNDFINSNDANEEDAVSMKGYPYLVDDGNEPSNGVTATQVWQCVDKLVKSPTSNGGHTRLNNQNANEESALLKDICLSHSFFNILLMRCAGYSLQEESRSKSRRFVEDGFLSMGDRLKMQERVFNIVEWELEFLFDVFYTKFYYLSTKGFTIKLKRLVGIFICLWFAIFELRRANRDQFIGPNIIQFHGHSLEVGVTRIVIILIATGELAQLCMRIFSNWTIVKLVCLYARGSSGPNNTFLIEKAIFIISSVKYHLCSCMFKPWKRKLGQYSLLESYDKVPLLTRLLKSLSDQRVVQKESPAVTLSKEVKAAIVSSLAEYGFTLSGGKACLVRNGLADQLSSFCNTELDGDVHVILVWHIATSICEQHFSAQLSHPTEEHFRVATQLSKYCAYLVLFAPELLSSTPYQTETTVYFTITGADIILKDAKDMAERCSRLTSYDLSPLEESRLASYNILARSVALANLLTSIFSEDSNRGWKVMAEFWVELILYIAPTEDATVHLERLAKGGEFITLLWALLTNAGITSRAHFPSTV